MREAGGGIPGYQPHISRHLSFLNEKCKRKPRYRSIAFDFTHEQSKPHMLTEEESVKESSKPRLVQHSFSYRWQCRCISGSFSFSIFVLISIPFTHRRRGLATRHLWMEADMACVSSRWNGACIEDERRTEEKNISVIMMWVLCVWKRVLLLLCAAAQCSHPFGFWFCALLCTAATCTCARVYGSSDDGTWFAATTVHRTPASIARCI